MVFTCCSAPRSFCPGRLLHGAAGERSPMFVMNQAVEDRVCKGGVAHQFMLVLDWKVAGHERRMASHQVAPFAVAERARPQSSRMRRSVFASCCSALAFESSASVRPSSSPGSCQRPCEFGFAWCVIILSGRSFRRRDGTWPGLHRITSETARRSASLRA